MNLKTDRIGETNINNQGFQMTIIAYRKNNDIDIKFFDDFIVRNKRYCHFKDGKIKHPLYNNNGCLTLKSIKKEKDSTSIPEKFMNNTLKQLNIEFTTQLTKTTFEWCGNYRYDFYIPSLNMIIETHGEQHYSEKGWISLKETQINDGNKMKLALNNKINYYLIVDCRCSKFKWLKENVIKTLTPYFNLSNINWENVWEDCQENKCKKVWELWNEGKSIKEISLITNITRGVIHNYLLKGKEARVCDYSIEESKKRGRKYVEGKNNWNTTSVICLTTKKIFFTVAEGGRYYGCIPCNIIKCCKGKRNYCGKYNDKKLVWRYLTWQHNKKYRRVN